MRTSAKGIRLILRVGWSRLKLIRLFIHLLPLHPHPCSCSSSSPPTYPLPFSLPVIAYNSSSTSSPRVFTFLAAFSSWYTFSHPFPRPQYPLFTPPSTPRIYLLVLVSTSSSTSPTYPLLHPPPSLRMTFLVRLSTRPRHSPRHPAAIQQVNLFFEVAKSHSSKS